MRPEEWKALEDRALWLLGHGDQASPREGLQGMLQQLRLWEYRGEGVHTSWTLILSARDYRSKPAVVREVSWNRSADWKARSAPVANLKRRRDGQPSIRIRDADMSWEDLNPFLETAGGLHFESPGKAVLPAAERHVFGLEGFRSLAHVRIEWSGRTPRELAPTVVWFRTFRNLLVETLKDREKASDGD